MVHVHFAYMFEAQRDFAKVVSQDVVAIHTELHVSHEENKHFLCLVGAFKKREEKNNAFRSRRMKKVNLHSRGIFPEDLVNTCQKI